jgi:hypothetical protein
MDTSLVQSLLGSVRRRLWQAHFVAAARWALWGSAGLLLLAVAMHVAIGPVRIDDLLIGIAVLWASVLAWAGGRRPSESASALWGDRHLGGASAYSTLLEMRNDAPAVGRVPAVRWLEQWAAASVPQARRLLADRRDPARLVRPLLSVLVAAVLAALVLTLPSLASPSRPEVAAPPAYAADPANPSAAPLASPGLASELASALRSAGSRNAPDRGSMGQAPTAGAGKRDDGTESPMADRQRAATAGEPAPATESPPGDAVGARQTGLRTPASGAGIGRDAGDSRDDRADAGVSRALPGSMAVQRRESGARNPTAEKRADMDQPATFDDDLTTAAGTWAEPAPAAATPPPAATATRLTPTEAAYVQAWMKTNVKR